MRAVGALIPTDQLTKDGTEQQPHITALFGLHADNPDEVRELLKDQPPITVTLGNASIFPAANTDSSRGARATPTSSRSMWIHRVLHRINALLRQLPHTNDFPTYQPHVTIAYLKPGQGAQYDGQSIPGVTGQTITLHSIAFSGKDGKQIEGPLAGKVSNSPENAANTAVRILGYHGTDAEPFEAFDPEKKGAATDDGDLGAGYYLSTDANIGRSSRTLIEAGIALANPLRLEMPDFRTDKNTVINRALGTAGLRGDALTQTLKDKGYDGVLLDYSPTGYHHTEIVAFDPASVNVQGLAPGRQTCTGYYTKWQYSTVKLAAKRCNFGRAG